MTSVHIKISVLSLLLSQIKDYIYYKPKRTLPSIRFWHFAHLFCLFVESYTKNPAKNSFLFIFIIFKLIFFAIELKKYCKIVNVALPCLVLFLIYGSACQTLSEKHTMIMGEYRSDKHSDIFSLPCLRTPCVWQKYLCTSLQKSRKED